MPESRFVSASRLRPLLGYFALAVVGLLIADWLVGVFSGSQPLRRLVVVGWLLLLPYGGWLIWKRP